MRGGAGAAALVATSPGAVAVAGVGVLLNDDDRVVFLGHNVHYLVFCGLESEDDEIVLSKRARQKKQDKNIESFSSSGLGESGS